ncbi:MAG: phage tail sheath family protein [bacterium]|jgi:hypothetical protein|nr:phage tail sheath subtilisin-like domain-containing protein [Betaproteobacteria bacterium]
MTVAVSYPGVYIEEVSSGVRSIAGVSTSIALFAGWSARGATDEAVRVNNFTEFERAFGGLDPRSLLAYSVRQFFDNGGSDTYVLRIAAADAVAAQAAIGANITVDARSTGAWANRYKVRTTRRAAPDAGRFRLDILDGDANDAIVETYENLSLAANDARFPSNIVNARSGIIRITATSAAAAPADQTVFLGNTAAQGAPAPVVAAATRAGVDGTVLSPADNDFRTALLARFGVGSITDRLDLFNLVCVPGLVHAATLASLQAECRRRRAFLIVDADPDATVASMASAGTAGLTGSDGLFSAVFFPWARAVDPAQGGVVRDFPPCGFVAGVMARTDGSRGVWKAPAGSDASLTGAVGLSLRLSDPQNGQLNPLGINCLRTLPVYGNVVWGARTLHGQNDRGSEWKYIPVRRTALFIEESLYRGTQWVVFEPNDEPLWAQIRLNIGAFMNNLFRQGAFQGRTPREAYFVKCDRETTTQNDIDNGIVNIHVGFAPLKPAEFVVLRIQQIAGDIAV